MRGSALVVAATGVEAVEAVDAAAATAARRIKALVNVVDVPAACDFILPSVLRRGDLQIAVSTGGKSPALAREIRRKLESEFGESCAAVVEWTGRERARVLASARPPLALREAAERVATIALRRLKQPPSTSADRLSFWTLTPTPDGPQDLAWNNQATRSASHRGWVTFLVVGAGIVSYGRSRRPPSVRTPTPAPSTTLDVLLAPPLH